MAEQSRCWWEPWRDAIDCQNKAKKASLYRSRTRTSRRYGLDTCAGFAGTGAVSGIWHLAVFGASVSGNRIGVSGGDSFDPGEDDISDRDHGDGCDLGKKVFGQYLFAPAFFWEDVFSFAVIGLHCGYVAMLWTNGLAPNGLMVLALAAYTAYVINAGQFIWKLRQARLDMQVPA